MRTDHLGYLCCPECSQALTLESQQMQEARIKEGVLRCGSCQKSYPVIDFIPRFVPKENYAKSFGMQWNKHSRTQYDSASGRSVSKERFVNETRWPGDLSGQIILEPASGSGRFTEHALETGAMVFSFDLSHAVEANYTSNGHHPNLLLVQADLFKLPFADGAVDKCFLFGALQHTPDAKAVLASLFTKLANRGELVVDNYPFNVNTLFNTKYWVRPFTKRLNHEKLYAFGRKYVDFLWPVTELTHKILPFKYAKRTNWRLLVPDYRHLGLDEKTLREWAYLDFFDMLSPQYDRPVTKRRLKQLLHSVGFEQVQVQEGHNGYEGRGFKQGNRP